MTHWLFIAIPLLIFASLSACSSCSGDDHATDSGLDGGMDADTDSDTDSDTDTDSDSDTDTDTDVDTDTDADTDGDGFVADAGPWIWEDLPDAGDCGVEGCKQLTFSATVDFLEWDVWGKLLTFTDGETTETRVVDYVENKQLLIPNPYPEFPVGTMLNAINLFPATTTEQMVCYSKLAGDEIDFLVAVICANLETEKQGLIYHRHEEEDVYPNPGKYIDIYGDRIVAMGGCGEVLDSWPLCAFDITAPGTYTEVAPSYYGGYNSMWGDVVVWDSGEANDYDIRGYDFSTSEFIEITDDTIGQIFPRMHNTRVVYQDLKLGSGDPMGLWDHSAIFMYDVVSHETTQITSGDWIAAYPDINGDRIVWQDYRACADPNNKNNFNCIQIWGYNLATETEFQVTDIPDRAKQTPRIWGDKVFVHMAKTVPDEDAIYMFDLPDGAK